MDLISGALDEEILVVSQERPQRSLGGHSRFLNGVYTILDVRKTI